jgi:hypothetical protein
MKKICIFLMFSALAVGCKPNVNPEDIAKINGYWEIEKVTLSDGSEKQYKISETIDLFEVTKNSGVRKKVKPQFDGKFLETGHVEKVTVNVEDDEVFLDYSTDYAHWKEQIVCLADSTLVLKNESNLEYHYKRARPFNIK